MKTLQSFVAALFSAVIPISCCAADAGGPQPQRVPVPPIPTAQASRLHVGQLPERTALPDPLELPEGKRIATTAAWEKHRDELKQLLMYYATGLMPPAPGNVTGRVLNTRALLDGAVKYQLVRLSFGPEKKLGFDIALFTPANKPGPFPVVIFPSFDQTPGAEPLPLMPRRPEQGKGGDALVLPLGIPEEFAPAAPPPPVEPEKFAADHHDTFARGYAIATYHYQDTGEDSITRNTDGSWAFRNSRFFPAYPHYDWGLLASWAWGISRCIDFLETQDFADKTRLIVTGHSRIGKAVLVAGAFDERIAISAPAGSAGGGVGAYRFCGSGRSGGEGLDDMMRKYPNWFSPNLYQFGTFADKLPFDQHWFVALTAPRGFVVLDGETDHICSPLAVRKTLHGAEPTYALYGATDKLGLHYSKHGHAFNALDWTALLDFADWHLRGQKPAQSFAFGAAAAE
jgi:hypothetical protein